MEEIKIQPISVLDPPQQGKPIDLTKAIQWYSLETLLLEDLKSPTQSWGFSLRDIGFFKDIAQEVERYAQLHFEMKRLKAEMQPVIDLTRKDGFHTIIDEFHSIADRITLLENVDGLGGSYFAKVGDVPLYIV